MQRPPTALLWFTGIWIFLLCYPVMTAEWQMRTFADVAATVLLLGAMLFYASNRARWIFVVVTVVGVAIDAQQWRPDARLGTFQIAIDGIAAASLLLLFWPSVRAWLHLPYVIDPSPRERDKAGEPIASVQSMLRTWALVAVASTLISLLTVGKIWSQPLLLFWIFLLMDARRTWRRQTHPLEA